MTRGAVALALAALAGCGTKDPAPPPPAAVAPLSSTLDGNRFTISGGGLPALAFEYESFPIPPTPGTNASPLAVAVDGAGRVWINSEFHKGEIHFFDPAAGKVVALPVPGAPEPGIHATTIFGDHRTTMTMCGEDIAVGPDGVVWWTEGGGYLYEGQHPNHSRIVAYDPATKEFRAFNVPGDRNEVIGLAWDAKRGCVWFTQGALQAGAKLWRLDPSEAVSDLTFDFAKEPPAKGLRSWDLPLKDSQPAHLAVDPDGSIWYSAYWRNRVGRFVPETGEFLEVPLPPGIGTSKPGKLVGGGPWTILVAPDGNVVFDEFFDSTLTRIDAALVRRGEPACRVLDARGNNACILQSLVVPDADLENEFVHSAAFDRAGRLWFTIHGPQHGPGRGSLGFVTPDWSAIVRLPTLPGGEGSAPDGIAIDPKTGDIWFAEYWRHRLGRLRKL